MKFTTSFRSSQFDWQLRNEIAKFVANFGNLKWTSETVCQKFCETYCSYAQSAETTCTMAYKVQSWRTHSLTWQRSPFLLTWLNFYHQAGYGQGSCCFLIQVFCSFKSGLKQKMHYTTKSLTLNDNATLCLIIFIDSFPGQTSCNMVKLKTLIQTVLSLWLCVTPLKCMSWSLTSCTSCLGPSHITLIVRDLMESLLSHQLLEPHKS